MTDAHYTFHPLTQRALALGNRSRHAPLTPSRDARPSDWSAVLIVFGGGAAFFFVLGLACRIAWQVLT